jgi:hypothetical protein
LVPTDWQFLPEESAGSGAGKTNVTAAIEAMTYHKAGGRKTKSKSFFTCLAEAKNNHCEKTEPARLLVIQSKRPSNV